MNTPVGWIVPWMLLVLALSPSFGQEVSYKNVLLSAQKIIGPAMSGSLPGNEVIENFLTRKSFMEYFIEILKDEGGASFKNDTGNISAVCLTHLNDTMKGLVKKDNWALQMLDADAKIPAGILLLNLLWMGNYDECISVLASVNVTDGQNRTVLTHPFKGQYCRAGIPVGPKQQAAVDIGESSIPPNDLSIAMCMPNTCSESDVKAFVNAVLSLIPGNKTLRSDVAICQKDHIPLDTPAIASITFFSILAFIIVVATLYDVLVINRLHVSMDTEEEEATRAEASPLLTDANDPESRNIKFRGYGAADEAGNKNIQEHVEPGLCAQILIAFSLYTNGSKLLSTRKQPGTLSCLNGIRFISMSWVILGHAYTFCLFQSNNLLQFIQEHTQRASFLAIMNATVSVDTFFILSGLLVAYLSLKELNRVGGVKNFRWGMFYFHRFWRLTPAYGLVMFLYIPLMRYVYDGPFWAQAGTEKNQCSDNWWMNLLYINNFFNAKDTCMAWSWYLANDMQFYVLSPLLLIPLYFSNVLGTLVCCFFLIGCWVVTMVISVTQNLPMTLFEQDGESNKTAEFFDNYYVKPYCRIGPYIVGMFVGFILYKTDCRKRLSRLQSWIGWCLAAVCCLSVLYGNYDTIRGVHIPSKAEIAIYQALHPSVWAFGVSWVMYSCATGTDILYVNKFLSWSIFSPLSRLTYLAYLLHPVLMEVYFGGKREAMYLTDMDCVFFFLGFMVTSYGLAFVLSLAIEAPFMGLEKAIFRRERKH